MASLVLNLRRGEGFEDGSGNAIDNLECSSLSTGSRLTQHSSHGALALLFAAFPPDWCSNIDSLKESFKMVNRLNWSSIEQSQLSGS